MSQYLPNSRIRLPHAVIVKAPGLLPMLYTVRELADELSMSERTLRDWLLHGAPHQRDHRGRMWIDGQAFARWVTGLRKNQRDTKLHPDEGYCMTCNQVVRMLSPTAVSGVGKILNMRGICPQCDRPVYRGTRRD